LSVEALSEVAIGGLERVGRPGRWHADGQRPVAYRPGAQGDGLDEHSSSSRAAWSAETTSGMAARSLRVGPSTALFGIGWIETAG